MFSLWVFLTEEDINWNTKQKSYFCISLYVIIYLFPAQISSWLCRLHKLPMLSSVFISSSNAILLSFHIIVLFSKFLYFRVSLYLLSTSLACSHLFPLPPVLMVITIFKFNARAIGGTYRVLLAAFSRNSYCFQKH